MNTLFNDSETFQKERPQKPTEKQVEEFYKKMAKEIKEEGFSQSNEDDIISDLRELYPFYDSGYEMAKRLEGWNVKANYQINASFIEWLENLDYEYRELNAKNIKEWVKAHNPQPLFTKGQKLLINEKLCYQKNAGSFVFVNGFSKDSACYLINENPNRQGGTVLAYELVEQRCSKADA